MVTKNASGVTLQDVRLFRQACYVDGAWTDAAAHGVIEVDNPATGEIVGTVPRLGAADTRRAIDAAARAFPRWRKATAKGRAAVMRRWRSVFAFDWSTSAYTCFFNSFASCHATRSR